MLPRTFVARSEWGVEKRGLVILYQVVRVGTRHCQYSCPPKNTKMQIQHGLIFAYPYALDLHFPGPKL